MFFNKNETYAEMIIRLHHEYGEDLKSKIDTITKQNNELSNKLKTMSIEFNVQQELLNNLYKGFNYFTNKQTNTVIKQNSNNLYTIVSKLKNGSTITYSTDDFALIEHIRKWWKHYNTITTLKHVQSSNHKYSYDFYHFYLDIFTLSRSYILSLEIKVA